jgi:hypothetical protein
MDRSPSGEGSTWSVSQELSSFPRNPEVQHRVPNSTQGQLDQIHTFRFHFNINLQSRPSSSKSSLPFIFSNKNCVAISHVFHLVAGPAHIIHLFYHVNNIRLGLQISTLFVM